MLKLMIFIVHFKRFYLGRNIFNNNKFTMSFFANQPRTLLSPSNKQSKLGPGTYEPVAKNPSTNAHGYAPFGSLSRKRVVSEKSNSLGPGEYEVSGQIVKPSITKYENPNSIIIKINEEGWSQFKSKTNRFQNSIIEESTTPGPGQYCPQRNRAKSQAKQFKRSSIGEEINQMNLKNYIQMRKPSLYSDPVKIDAQQPKKKAKCKGPSWSLNKKQRFEPLEKETFHEEHKLQLIDEIKGHKKKQRTKSQSAVFASKSLKSQFQAEIYQTSNPFKVELRKMINYKDERPGPGSYQCAQNEFSRNFRFQKHQFFGSTVQRFKTTESLGPNLGPGYYQKTKQDDSKNRQNVHINQGQLNRHSYIPQNVIKPGPGSYSYDKNKKHKTSCKWVFGSKQPRFSEQSTIEQNEEEVDQYELLRRMRKEKQFEYRKQFLSRGKQANFASKTNRFQEPTKCMPNLPIGHYDTTQTDIASKQMKSVHTQNQIKRITKQVVSVPFMSTVGRFKTQPQQQQQHTHTDCWCLVKSVQKQVYHHQSVAFTSKEKRTVVFESKRYTPAVGTYTQEKPWVKSSFNSRFLKASETKSKKLKIWNNHKQQVEKGQLTTSAREKELSLLKIN